MKLLIRADATTRIGTGHVMRCLALAQVWQEKGGNVYFVMALKSASLEARLIGEGFHIIHIAAHPGSQSDAEQTINLARSLQSEWVVVDGYHFSANYQKALKKADLKLLFVDDYGHAEHYYADLVLNQNIYATETLYSNREPHTRLLLGTNYVLLRREFWPWRDWSRQTPNVANKVLVTLGGGDSDNQTLKAIRALQQAAIVGLEAMVIVGGSNPHQTTLETAVKEIPGQIQLVHNVSNMPTLMAWADVAISAGGSTCWELAFMGLPALIMVIADNQRGIAAGLDKAGAALNVGWFETVMTVNLADKLRLLLNDSGRWQQISDSGQQLVDGGGTIRTVQAMQGKPQVRLRPVTIEDCQLVWEWANDLHVRASAFSSEPIPWKTHVAWFQYKLNDPDCIHYIALDTQNNNIGQIRFDIESGRAVVSVSIDQRKRGFGYGTEIIKQGVNMLMKANPVEIVEAFVKVENKSSIRAFEKAGFCKQGRQLVKGFDSVYFTWGKV